MTRVGVLGATNVRGCRHLRRLVAHDTFDLGAVTGVNDEPGQEYGAVAQWPFAEPVPSSVAEETVAKTDPEAMPDDVAVLFSALPQAVAERAEHRFASAGYTVVSTTPNERLAEDVPLVVPGVNSDHLGLLEVQDDARSWDGRLLKTPAAAAATAAIPLAALEEFSPQQATVVAMGGSAVGVERPTGAIDNVHPHVPRADSRLQTEPAKLLGTFDGSAVSHHDCSLAASCYGIPISEATFESVWVDTDADASQVEVERALREAEPAPLPSAPADPMSVFVDADRPQPRLDVGDGVEVAVGPATETTAGVQFDCLSHGRDRWSAAASVLLGELLVDGNYL